MHSLRRSLRVFHCFLFLFCSQLHAEVVVPPPTGNTNEIAAKLVEEIGTRLEAKNPKVENPSRFQKLTDAKLVHVFGLDIAPAVLLDGSLSYAEVLSDRNAPQNRLVGDGQALGVAFDFSKPLHRQLLPKYAYVVLPNRPASEGFGKSTKSWGHFYGEVFAVMNDDVKQRSLWQYGNSGSLHSFRESLMKPSEIREPHLEALILGTVERSDFDYLVIPEVALNEIEKQRVDVNTKTRSDFPFPAYYDSAKKAVQQFDDFMLLTKALAIPVLKGEIRYGLKPPEKERTVFMLKESINQVAPGAPRPNLSREEIVSLLGKNPGVDRVDMSQVFTPGLSSAEHVQRYQAALVEYLQKQKCAQALAEL